MKNYIIIIVCFLAVSLFGQSEKTVDSKVTAATVFKNRALVTREAEVSLPAGKHKIIVSNLPVDLEDESVRISSDLSSIKILDVEVETKYTTEFRQDKIKSLQSKVDSLNQLIQIASDKILVYNSERDFIESLKGQASKVYTEKMLRVNSTAEWTDMLRYVQSNLTEVLKGIREQNWSISLYKQQVNVLNKEISDSKSEETKNYKEIIVNLENSVAGKIKLLTSYLVQNAGWYPVYDARISIADKNTELHYFGMVHQSTGEDWNNISVNLSTAEPMSVKSLPELSRWFIDISRNYPVTQRGLNSPASISPGINYSDNRGLPKNMGTLTGYVFDQQTGEPLIGTNVVLEGTKFGAATNLDGKFYISNVPAGYYRMVVSYVGYEQRMIPVNILEKKSAEMRVSIQQSSIESDGVYVVAERPMVEKSLSTSVSSLGVSYEDINYTNISNTELSTNFEVPAKSSIPSDNSPHKVTIAVSNLPAAFSYTSIPKISPAVYLKGKIVNKNDYPLLEGQLNIFVDNDFINNTSIGTLVPADTMELALGVDDKIKIKKVLINKYEETKGLLSGSKQITYEYEIQLINNRKSDENILIVEQVPITMNEDIKVRLLEPDKEIKDLGNDNKIEWNKAIKPGEKITIPFKYQVQFPTDMRVSGLE